MGVTRALMAACLLALLAVAVAGLPSMESLESMESDLALLEADASATPAEQLAEAEAYANKKVNAAVSQGKQLLVKAVAAGRADAKALGPAPAKPLSAEVKAALALKAKQAKQKQAKLKKSQNKAEKKAIQALALKVDKRAAKKAAAKKAQRQAANKAARKLAKANSPFNSVGLKHDANGVFGGVSFGISKVNAVPSTAGLKKKGRRSALQRIGKHSAKKNIYGRKKSCLKDIAAHFDEKDIYDSKKLSLLQQMSTTRSRAHAHQLRSRLQSLETWHQMMQRKFMASASESKAQAKRVNALFDEHLSSDLKNQLAQNKAAKRAGKKLPFPHAHDEAVAVLRRKRSQIVSSERAAEGGKRMLRPEINDKDFPSMDPISSMLREKLWRVIGTEDELNTDRREIERAENIVTAAHKLHGDFVDGPIAEPLLRGKLYHPDTEILGSPNFLKKFPWPKVEEKVTMNDKAKVEQTYHQTW